MLSTGTWNVRTTDPSGKLGLLPKELGRVSLEIGLVGVCKRRWKGEGEFKSDDKTTIFFSGKEEGKKENRVAVILRGLMNFLFHQLYINKTTGIKMLLI